MPTVPDSPSLPSRFSGDASLRVSLAASVVVHVATIGALAFIIGGLDRGTNARTLPVGPDLEVVLTFPRAAADPAIGDLAVVTAPAAPVKVATAQKSAARKTQEPALSAAPAPPNAGDASGLARSSVSVTDRFPMARFGDFLDGDRLAWFPREIDTPVRLPGKLDVPYPPAALAAREEGTILVFAVVAEDGSVEQSHLQFEQGSRELGEAVETALRRTRFLPAEDGGKAIRFYVTLEFVFRIETPDGSVTAGDNATAPPSPLNR